MSGNKRPERTVIEEVIFEAARRETFAAAIKHPEWPTDAVHAAAIVAEEAGELVQAALDFHYHRGGRQRIRVEAVQTMAMALRLLLNLRGLEPGLLPLRFSKKMARRLKRLMKESYKCR